MGKAIAIGVENPTLVPLNQLEVIQGNLKTLSQESYVKLRDSIDGEGFCFIIHVWRNPKSKKLSILDGTQRFLTVQAMIGEGWECESLPVAFVKAANLKEAAKKLLAGASAYGSPDEEGLYELMHMAGLKPLDIKHVEMAGIDMEDFCQGHFGDGKKKSDGDGGTREATPIECPKCGKKFLRGEKPKGKKK